MTSNETLNYLKELCSEGYPYGSILQTAERDSDYLNDLSRSCNNKDELARYFYED